MLVQESFYGSAKLIVAIIKDNVIPMRTKIIQAKITKVLTEFGSQIYEVHLIGESSPVPINFASFAVLDFGDFQEEKKYFRNIGPDGLALVLIHRCPKYKKTQHPDAYYVWENRRDVIRSCSNCNYRFQAVALPNEIEVEKKIEDNETLNQLTREDP